MLEAIPATREIDLAARRTYCWAMTKLPRPIVLLVLSACCFSLNSCGLVRSLIQIPGRTLQSVGRTVGFGIEATETTTTEHEVSAKELRTSR